MNIVEKLKPHLDNCYEVQQLYPNDNVEQRRAVKILFDEIVLHADWLRNNEEVLLAIRNKLLLSKYDKGLDDFDEYYKIIFSQQIPTACVNVMYEMVLLT